VFHRSGGGINVGEVARSETFLQLIIQRKVNKRELQRFQEMAGYGSPYAFFSGMRILLWIATATLGGTCFAQSIGVIGGARISGEVTAVEGNGLVDASKRYVVGPTVEVGLLHGFGIEIDAMYRREGYQDTSAPFYPLGTGEWERANTWEFPVLVRYSLGSFPARPFVEGGFASRVAFGSVNVVDWFGLHGVVGGQYDVNRPSVGGVIGGGVQLAFGRLRVAPSLRYTRWNNTTIDQPSLVVPATTLAAKNQIDLLLNIGWKIH
jgi:hypothetical protein